MKAGKFLMLGIVSDDVEKTVSYFKQFGFEDWTYDSFRSENIPNVLLNGKPGVLDFDAAMFKSETINIEILKPISEGIFMDFLREHGPGIHHLEFEPSDGYESFLKSASDAGYASLLDADLAWGASAFSYLDTEKQLGFRIEIHK